MASIRWNESSWISLNNKSVSIAEPGRSYGGIGGGFATLSMTIALPEGGLTDGENRFHFRFDRSGGVVSGFRVLALNLLTKDGRAVLPASGFIQEDPEAWTAPLPGRRDLAEGERLWRSAVLQASNRRGALTMRAHCADCHAQDGRDLKYFNYSNHSIIVRSRFHGLSEKEGQQIASYIRMLPFPALGRPWNPPYQPGPALASVPASAWAAGAGLTSVPVSDHDTLRYILDGTSRKDTAKVLPADLEIFAPDGELDAREIPISLQLPDWNHWLPQVHPADAWGDRFTQSKLSKAYERSTYQRLKSPTEFRRYFERWLGSRKQFLHGTVANSQKWSPGLTKDLYSTLLWQLVKTWEITERFNLESPGGSLDLNTNPVTAASRFVSWKSLIPSATAPAEAGIPDTADGMNGSGLTNEYFSNAWYELQILLNSGDHKHRNREPVDWIYVAGHLQTLERLSGCPEPGRLIVMAIKSNQSADPALGPRAISEGWRLERVINPRLMLAPEWNSTFSQMPDKEKSALAQAWLAAWLEKTARYPATDYFTRGQLPVRYPYSKDLQAITGDGVAQSSTLFRHLGIDSRLADQLESWGRSYEAAAILFHY